MAQHKLYRKAISYFFLVEIYARQNYAILVILLRKQNYFSKYFRPGNRAGVFK